MEPMDYNGGWDDEPEIKNVDRTFTNTVAAATTTASFAQMTWPTQGVGSNQSLGRSIFTTSLEWNWNGHIATTETGAAPLSLRFIADLQPHKAVALITDIYVTDEIGGLDNLDNEGRFVEIDRWDIDCVNQSTGAWSASHEVLVGERVTQTGAGGAPNDCTDWQLYLVVYQDGGLLVNAIDRLVTRLNFTG